MGNFVTVQRATGTNLRLILSIRRLSGTIERPIFTIAGLIFTLRRLTGTIARLIFTLRKLTETFERMNSYKWRDSQTHLLIFNSFIRQIHIKPEIIALIDKLRDIYIMSPVKFLVVIVVGMTHQNIVHSGFFE